jgi:hypothetical protein
MTIDVAAGSYTGNAPSTATAMHLDSSGGSMNATVTGGTYTNNNVAVNVSTALTGDFVFDVNGVTATGNRSHGLNLFMNANSTGSATGKFRNNIVGTSGTAGSGSNVGYGLRIQNEAQTTAAPLTLLIDSNQITETTSFSSMNVNQGIATGTPSPLYLTVKNNTFSNSGARGLAIQQVNTTASPGTLCADIFSNTFSGTIIGQAGDGSRMRLDQNVGGVFNVHQTDLNNLAASNTGISAAQISLGGTVTFNQPTCPSVP